MASVVSQLTEEVTAYAQSVSPEDAREKCADGTYFPNKLRIFCVVVPYNHGFWVQNLIHVTHLLPTILRWLLDFWKKIVHPWLMIHTATTLHFLRPITHKYIQMH